jgi:hypothetical protein
MEVGFLFRRLEGKFKCFKSIKIIYIKQKGLGFLFSILE